MARVDFEPRVLCRSAAVTPSEHGPLRAFSLKASRPAQLRVRFTLIVAYGYGC